jgi:hypothetical protein
MVPVRHIESKMTLLDCGGQGSEARQWPDHEGEPPRISEVAPKRTFRGDGLTDAMGEISIRKFNFGVFTQPGPMAEVVCYSVETARRQ